tara:strand:- start:863 stop:1108 length:246 start_codon:yes stop_codon:yes gene_type:complete
LKSSLSRNVFPNVGALLSGQKSSAKKNSFEIFVLLDLVNFSYLAVQSLEKSRSHVPRQIVIREIPARKAEPDMGFKSGYEI